MLEVISGPSHEIVELGGDTSSSSETRCSMPRACSLEILSCKPVTFLHEAAPASSRLPAAYLRLRPFSTRDVLIFVFLWR